MYRTNGKRNIKENAVADWGW